MNIGYVSKHNTIPFADALEQIQLKLLIISKAAFSNVTHFTARK
jgi:hypothetical protein